MYIHTHTCRYDLRAIDYFEQSLVICEDNADMLGQAVCLQHLGNVFKMQKDNNLAVEKSGSGLDAIRWAESGEWDLLEAYCMQDVHVLRALLQQSVADGLHLHVRRSACFSTSQYVLRLVEGYSSCVVRPVPHAAVASGADASDRGLSSFLSSACRAAPGDCAGF